MNFTDKTANVNGLIGRIIKFKIIFKNSKGYTSLKKYKKNCSNLELRRFKVELLGSKQK